MSPAFREAVVAEAREWIGTPFRWQASQKQVGADCMGLVVGVARELGRSENAPRWNYTAKIDPRELRAGLLACLDPVEEAEAGDVLLLRVGGKAQHLAIYAGEGRMIHTYGKGPAKVIEVPMGSVWWGAVDSIWTWRRHVS